jgi:hypothetical protein
MRAIKHQRDVPSLFDIITRLQERVAVLEKAPRLGSTSIDSGELTLNGGNIVVRDEFGVPILSIIGGDSPMIVMQPNGGTDFKLVQLGWESPTQGAAFQIDVQRLVDSVRDGGKLLLMRDAAYLSHQPDAASEAFWAAGAIGDGFLSMKGRFGDGFVPDSETAVVCGQVAIGAGVSTFTYTYSTPLATAPGVVYGLLNSAGAVTHSLTASSATSFTVAWSGTLAKTLYFWAFRL